MGFEPFSRVQRTFEHSLVVEDVAHRLRDDHIHVLKQRHFNSIGQMILFDERLQK